MEYRTAAVDSMRELMYLLSVKSCKYILLVTNYELESEHYVSHLNVIVFLFLYSSLTVN